MYAKYESITLRSSTIVFQVETLRRGKKINWKDSMLKERLNSWQLFECTKRRDTKSLNCFTTDRSVIISSFIKIQSHNDQIAKESSSFSNFHIRSKSARTCVTKVCSAINK